MAPFKSTGGFSVGKLLGVFRDRDLTLNSSVRTDRTIEQLPFFLAAAAGPGSSAGYYEVKIDGPGSTGTTFNNARAFLWATSDSVAVQWLTNHGFTIASPTNARQVTTSRTSFTIDASLIPSSTNVIAFGAGGGHAWTVSQPASPDANNNAAEGGTIHLTAGFTPGTYKVVIGQGGQQGVTVGWNLGGYGGGGDGRQNRAQNHAGGGGGLTGLYQPGWPGAFNVPEAITNAYLIAAGGGGSGYYEGLSRPAPIINNNPRITNGGSGGYPRGDDGAWYASGPDEGGRGATQSAAGAGGGGRTAATGDPGSFSRGGNGVNTTPGGSGDGSGGGGGGYYGGGGGGPIVGAGGGGSSFAPAPSTKTGYYGWNPVGGWGMNGKGTVRDAAANSNIFGSTPYNDPDSSGAGGLLYIYF